MLSCFFLVQLIRFMRSQVLHNTGVAIPTLAPLGTTPAPFAAAFQSILLNFRTFDLFSVNLLFLSDFPVASIGVDADKNGHQKCDDTMIFGGLLEVRALELVPNGSRRRSSTFPLCVASLLP